MSTTNSTWPRQLRLPGQVAAAEGPIDMRMMYVMHHAFRRDLDLFAAAVRATPGADRSTWALLADRWELFAEVLHEHHTVEDAGIWPALTRLGTAADVAVLDAMEAEHGEIDPLLDGCATGFRRLAQGSGQRGDEDARAALAVRVSAARESLRRHLAHEETEAIAIVQRLLTAEDWARIEEEHAGTDVRLSQVVRIVPWAAYGVPREALDRVFAQPGGRGFRLVWLLTRGRFARRHARTFRYA
ncbi:hemerythrin domain-containing protein [Nocardioides sp. YIM 152315]|uniref:hemerythrin domain-containing protein n=1 Tax=Nocardioides sp. YIM 152315 TaxID=3031760 RepID=UPI0023D9ACDE|nr:hemerythrin domain-containing protein [Nocardioides sp. YIM 152315]MDF1606305.1 hemerythrin domain-containing protein [Nocardioides sp. YIM 152315]